MDWNIIVKNADVSLRDIKRLRNGQIIIFGLLAAGFIYLKRKTIKLETKISKLEGVREED